MQRTRGHHVPRERNVAHGVNGQTWSTGCFKGGERIVFVLFFVQECVVHSDGTSAVECGSYLALSALNIVSTSAFKMGRGTLIIPKWPLEDHLPPVLRALEVEQPIIK